MTLMTSGGLELIAILHGRERASYLTELKDLTGLDNLNVYSSELIKDKCYKNKTTLSLPSCLRQSDMDVSRIRDQSLFTGGILN